MTVSEQLGRVAGPGGMEPPPDGLGLLHEEGRSLWGTWRGERLFRYVYQPWDAQIESPRPYFHPVRTLGGELATIYRPHDHVWHKGIAWSLCVVNDENFWGGPTYVRDRGYQQLPNNGSMRHERFERIGLRDGVLRVDERLTWTTEAGQDWISELRGLGVAALPEAGAWRLSFSSQMLNTSGHSLSFGSPTTHGRENAGYSGLMWRGPRSFTGGQVITPDGPGGDEQMGRRGPWLAFTGRHDGDGTASTVLFRDDPGNYCAPTEWFVRSTPFGCICPAPFFSSEYSLAAGETLALRYDVFIADGALGTDDCQRLADRAAAGDLLEHRP